MDDYDSVRMISSRNRIARKHHTCSECGRLIATGETYLYEAYKDEDIFFQNKTCPHCQAARFWLIVEHGWFLHEGLSEMLENCWDEHPSFTLGRLVVGMRRRWKGFKVPMMPIPVLSE